MKPRKIYNHKLIYFLAVLCIILFATIEYYFITPINNYNENISLVKKEDLYNHYKRKIQTQPYYKYNIKTNSIIIRSCAISGV